jgi:hypothetical protein
MWDGGDNELYFCLFFLCLEWSEGVEELGKYEKNWLFIPFFLSSGL